MNVIIRKVKGLKKRYKSWNQRRKNNNYINKLRRCGISIGGGCRFFSPENTIVDTQNPHLITFGDNVRVTYGCIILTHDYSWSVVAAKDGLIFGGTGHVKIGNNVFIGMNTIILKDTVIGDNVIIGAGSIVHGAVEENSVYAGNPAHKICSLDEYTSKLKNRSLESCISSARLYKNSTGKDANESVLREYFYLFKPRVEELNEDQKDLMERTGFPDLCLKKYIESEPVFNGISGVLSSININNSNFPHHLV